AYDGLTAEQKALVGNYEVLTAAETAYETAKADKEAADEVAALIANIGTVTVDSKAAIEGARKAYDGLTAEQKALVGNYGTLTAAETAYAALVEDKEEESVSTGESASAKEESASEEEKKGCGSSVGIGSVLGIMLIACALFLFKKKGFIR
ncbi:MAG: bifunctional metallophosphatase/5'-nucleotidase, partial [Clostridia bacterium]|nr:bifunctional metallophosphatase/5'-nucleotidase [Clostridia bacterium]